MKQLAAWAELYWKSGIDNDVAIDSSTRAQRNRRAKIFNTHLKGHERSWDHPANGSDITAARQVYSL
jgi:hypothetical protein